MHKFSKETQGLILGQIEIGPFGVVAQKRKEKKTLKNTKQPKMFLFRWTFDLIMYLTLCCSRICFIVEMYFFFLLESVPVF